MNRQEAGPFGAALRERRTAAGLSQRELAERTGLDFTYISKIENGRVPAPAADTVVRICLVLCVPAEELLALTGKIPSEVQQAVSSSSGAQKFLFVAQQMGLTEEEWRRLEASLGRLRDEEP